MNLKYFILLIFMFFACTGCFSKNDISGTYIKLEKYNDELFIGTLKLEADFFCSFSIEDDDGLTVWDSCIYEYDKDLKTVTFEFWHSGEKKDSQKDNCTIKDKDLVCDYFGTFELKD